MGLNSVDNGFIVFHESEKCGPQLAIFPTLPAKIVRAAELPDFLGEPEWRP